MKTTNNAPIANLGLTLMVFLIISIGLTSVSFAQRTDGTPSILLGVWGGDIEKTVERNLAFAKAEHKRLEPEKTDIQIRGEMLEKFAILKDLVLTFNRDGKFSLESTRDASERAEFVATFVTKTAAIGRPTQITASTSDNEFIITLLSDDSIAVRSGDPIDIVFKRKATVLAADPMKQVSELVEKGKFIEAEPLAIQELSETQQRFGKEHANTITSMNNLGYIYEQQEKFDKAIDTYKNAYELCEKSLGREHEITAQLLNNLSVVYMKQGNLEAASPLLRRALGIREKTLNEKDPALAETIGNLGSLYQKQGKLASSGFYFAKQITILESSPGIDNLQYATALGNLGLLFFDEKQYEDAQQLMTRALEISRKTLGKEHPHTAFTLINLGSLYEAQGNFGKAEQMYLQSLQIIEKTFGENHSGIANSLNNLGTLYRKQQKFSEAERVLIRALRICENTFGPSHSTTRTTRKNLLEVRANLDGDGSFK